MYVTRSLETKNSQIQRMEVILFIRQAIMSVGQREVKFISARFCITIVLKAVKSALVNNEKIAARLLSRIIGDLVTLIYFVGGRINCFSITHSVK